MTFVLIVLTGKTRVRRDRAATAGGIEAMRSTDGWRGGLGRWLLAAGLLSGSGCLTLKHALPPPQPEWHEPGPAVPTCCRNHVYVFLVNGCDPVNCGNLTGVRDHLHTLGFIKTYYGQVYHTRYFANEIRKVRQDDADARFVLIGFDLGARAVQALAGDLGHEGVCIDLVIYLSAKGVKDETIEQPATVVRAVNIQADGCLGKGGPVTGADNVHLPDVSRYGSPTHHYTLQRLASELAQVAASVPVKALPAPPPPPEPELAPTPRPLKPMPSAERDEWDFLKPVDRLGPRPPAPANPAR